MEVDVPPASVGRQQSHARVHGAVPNGEYPTVSGYRVRTDADVEECLEPSRVLHRRCEVLSNCKTHRVLLVAISAEGATKFGSRALGAYHPLGADLFVFAVTFGTNAADDSLVDNRLLDVRFIKDFGP